MDNKKYITKESVINFLKIMDVPEDVIKTINDDTKFPPERVIPSKEIYESIEDNGYYYGYNILERLEDIERGKQVDEPIRQLTIAKTFFFKNQESVHLLSDCPKCGANIYRYKEKIVGLKRRDH